MTNVVRHARAQQCTIRLGGNGALEVEIVDDGDGIPDEPPTGVGLTSMRERAVELGGYCSVGPGPGGGTTVRARLPLEPR
jgi:two-component system, NarL family, sensor kinase